MREYNGLYQAIVESNRDPKGQRRITARVPDVLGKTVSEWARPASIVDSPLPPGSMVWIHFPNGDLRYPVYHVPNDPKHGRVIPGKSALSVDGPGAAGVTLNADVHAKSSTGGYVKVYATEFVPTSSMEMKQDIEPAHLDAVEVVKQAPAYFYRYISDGDDGPLQIGPMREHLPSFVHRDEHHVSQGSIIGILWKAVSQLSQEVRHLRREVAALKENGSANTLREDL